MVSLPLLDQHFLEFLDRHAGLLGADILDVEAEDPGEFRQVVDVAAGVEQLEHVAVADRLLLLLVEAVLVAVGLLVLQEFLAVVGVVERVAHLVEGIALHGLVAIEDDRAGYRLVDRVG